MAKLLEAMDFRLQTPKVEDLSHIVETLGSWQSDSTPCHLHPGDIGWFQRFGAEKTAQSLRLWYNENDIIVAIGLLDGDDLIRAATDPDPAVSCDEALAKAIVADMIDPNKGVLPAGQISIDISPFSLARTLLLKTAGFSEGEEWTWLRKRMDNSSGQSNDEPMLSTLRLETVESPSQIASRVAIQGLSFGTSSFTEEKWHMMASGLAYKSGRCLLAYNANDEVVGATTIWSAGPGRPGILEPVGISKSHQGRGFGKLMCRAAAEQLRQMGASSAVVFTPVSNTAAVATYRASGFTEIYKCRDICRVA